MKFFSVIFCCVIPVFSSVVLAADSPATANMHVTLEVVKSCTLKANDLNFSRHSSDEASEIRASTQLDLTCTNGTPYTLSANSSDITENGTFWLKPEDNSISAQPIAWKLYADESKQNQVTSSQGITGTGNGQSQTETLYGVIEPGSLANAHAGVYSDDVTLNLVY